MPFFVTQSILIALPQLTTTQAFLKILLAATICAHLSEPRLEAFLYEFVVDKSDLVDLNAVIFSKNDLRTFFSFLS